jgi:hypothetical protein
MNHNNNRITESQQNADWRALWLSDPFVSRAAARSNFGQNGSISGMLDALTEVMTDVEKALPGIDFRILSKQLAVSTTAVDLPAMHASLIADGRTHGDATLVCQSIDRAFEPVAA